MFHFNILGIYPDGCNGKEGKMSRWLTAVLVLLCVGGVFLGEPPAVWSADAPAAAAQMGKVNINTATVAQLTALPGVGETIAQAIVE